MEQLPDPHRTPITPETVADFDPKIQEILLRNANKATPDEKTAEPVITQKVTIDPKIMADAARHAKHIESTLPPEDDN